MNIKTFEMPIVDVFTITGRGTVITGTVAYGSIALGDMIRIGDQEYACTGIEQFVNRMGRPAVVGENVGLLLRGAEKDEIMKWRGTNATSEVPFGSQEDDSAQDQGSTAKES